jgi:hypothetical protein
MERAEKIIDPFKPFFQIESDLGQPRRFAGVSLPLGRYYTISMTSSGNDHGTLCNELRAYRNPEVTGRVDVVDLGLEAREPFGPRRPAVAVILYDVHKIPYAEQLLRSSVDGSKYSKQLLVIEYPYEIREVRIGRVIDLRLTNARKWFFDRFSEEQEDGAILWSTGSKLSRELPNESREKLERDSVTIISRFQRRAGTAPMPKDFYAMLPTLMNPELGGGTTADGGATLQAIGTWMCQNRVEALIYPSARSDTFVELSLGTIKNCGGWNLVDYREYKYQIEGRRVRYSFIVQSPWAWIAFPRDVYMEFGDKNSAQSGSFRIVGMEAYWRRDY